MRGVVRNPMQALIVSLLVLVIISDAYGFEFEGFRSGMARSQVEDLRMSERFCAAGVMISSCSTYAGLRTRIRLPMKPDLFCRVAAPSNRAFENGRSQASLRSFARAVQRGR